MMNNWEGWCSLCGWKEKVRAFDEAEAIEILKKKHGKRRGCSGPIIKKARNLDRREPHCW